ncbi:MAG TPA: DUF2683 family protein [Pelobium sp.]
MESITIYPKDEKQKFLLQSLFAEMKVRFKVEHDETEMSKEEFFAKIDRSKEQAKRGEVYELTPELKAELFKSIL